MNLRTGDILVWRSTNFYDALSDSTIMIGAFHAGVVLKGKSFSTLSVCGKSPTDTYCTFLVDQVFPVEEIIGHIWHRPNGSALFHIRRMAGPDIPEELASQVLSNYLQLEKFSGLYSAYIAIAAYFRIGGIAPSSGHESQRWHVCSLLIAYCLEHFGLMSDELVANNLLPLDFYELTFYQKYPYERIEIFDKQTHTYAWMLSGILTTLGFYDPPEIRCQVVDQMLHGYDYPRSVQGSIKKKADKYLKNG